MRTLGTSKATLSLLAVLVGSHALAAESPRQSLFADSKPIEVTIKADFTSDELSPDLMTLQQAIMGNEQLQPIQAKMVVPSQSGGKTELNVQIRLRGKDRLMNCKFPPLKINFKNTDKQKQEQTEFKELRGLKLVTHCDRSFFSIREDEEDDLKVGPHALQQEFLIYKTYQRLTENSFGVRFAKITYVDTSKRKKPLTRLAFFIEGEKDLAHRLGVSLIKTKTNEDSGPALNIKPNTLNNAEVEIFQTMICNDDSSSDANDPGNSIAVTRNDGQGAIIPYDFDRSSSFILAKFSPIPNGPATGTRALDALSCVDPAQREELIARFQDLAKKLIEDVKKHDQFSAQEKKRCRLTTMASSNGWRRLPRQSARFSAETSKGRWATERSPPEGVLGMI